jgi:hypothetical protein
MERSRIISRCAARVGTAPFVAVVALSLLGNSAIVHAQNGPAGPAEASRVVDVSFQGNCEDPVGEPIFQLRFEDSGDVTYVGGNTVRVRGARSFQVPRRSVRALASSVYKDLGKSDFDRYHPENLPADWGDHGKVYDQPCLSLAVTEGDAATRSGRILSSSALGVALERRIEALVDLQSIVCPVRDFHVVSACPAPDFGFALIRNRDTCLSPHIVNFYRKGIAHYFVQGILGGDVYLDVVPDNVRDLVEFAASLKGETVMPVAQSGSTGQAVAQELVATDLADPSATTALSERITSLLGFDWRSTPQTQDPKPCDLYRRAYPRGTTFLPAAVVLSGH